jgi:hypothetical protein
MISIQDHYGRRGQYLVEAIGKGEHAFDSLTGRPRNRDQYFRLKSPRPPTISVTKLSTAPRRKPQVLRIIYKPNNNLLSNLLR